MVRDHSKLDVVIDFDRIVTNVQVSDPDCLPLRLFSLIFEALAICGL